MHIKGWPLIATLALFGCDDGGEDGVDDVPDASTSGADASISDAGAPPYGDHVTEGLTLAGASGLLSLTMTEVVFQPPIRDDNVWSFELISEADGAPTSGCEITLDPRMPAHGDHGTSKTPQISDLGDGLYRVTDVYLFMRGLWVVTLSAACEGVEDTFTLEVWIEG